MLNANRSPNTDETASFQTASLLSEGPSPTRHHLDGGSRPLRKSNRLLVVKAMDVVDPDAAKWCMKSATNNG
jgi:hypothetical protein